MADFLGRLAARSLGKFPVAQPVVPPMFSPAGSIEQPEPSFDAGSRIEAAVQARNSMEPALPAGTEAVAREKNSSRTPVRVQPAPTTVTEHLQPPKSPVQAGPAGRESISSLASERIENVRIEQRAADFDTLSVVPNHQRVMPDAWPVAPDLRQEFAVPGALPSFPNEARPRASAAGAPAATPAVRVTIGRVEVRAEFPAPSTRPAARPAQPATLSLEEYARQRREGKR